MLSRTVSESLHARSSQADCVSFRHGDESWSADQASVALITSPWGNVREGSYLLTRPWQVKGNDRKHGRDRSAAVQSLRSPCGIGRDACNQLSFPMGILLAFPICCLHLMFCIFIVLLFICCFHCHFQLWCNWYCCNITGGVALIVWFTTNGMCAKNKNIYARCEQAIIREIATHDLYCCLLSRCKALRICFSGFSDHNNIF